MLIKIEMEVSTLGRQDETMSWTVDHPGEEDEFIKSFVREINEKFLHVAIDNGRHIVLSTNDIVRVTFTQQEETTDGHREVSAETAGPAECTA